MKVTTYNREQTLKVSAGGHEPLKRGEWNWPAKKLPFHTMDVSDPVTQDALMPDDTSAELARLLVEIGWSQRELARRLNVTESTTRSWASGRRECHFTVLEWLRGIQVQPRTGDVVIANRSGGPMVQGAQHTTSRYVHSADAVLLAADDDPGRSGPGGTASGSLSAL